MGRIILPSSGIPRPQNIIALPTMGVAGLYRLQTHKYKSGTLKYDTGWINNIITDVGLADWYTLVGLGSFDTWGSMCASSCVGTGNTAPAVTDTQLAAFRAYVGPKASGGGTGFAGFDSTAYVAAAGSDPAYWRGVSSWQYGTGAASGNLTEVGVYPGNPGGGAVAPYYAGHLFSRALILDANGNPTSITVLSDEILTVTWQLRFYLDLTDHAFSFNLNGSPVTGTYRMYQAANQRASSATGATRSNTAVVTAYNGAMVSVLSGNPSTPLGSTSGSTVYNFVNDLANSGVLYVDSKLNAGVNTMNGTINTFIFQNHMWSYQFGNLSQPIVKTSGQQLQMNFRTSWGRYTP